MRSDVEKATNFIENLFNKRASWEVVSQDVAENATYEHPILKDLNTVRALNDCLPGFRNIFPDLQQPVISSGVLSNGHVIVNTRASATFLGDYADVKANGRRWDVPVYWEFEFENGKIKSASELGNHHAINEQLGFRFFKAPFELAEEEAVKKKSAVVVEHVTLYQATPDRVAPGSNASAQADLEGLRPAQ